MGDRQEGAAVQSLAGDLVTAMAYRYVKVSLTEV